MAAAGKKSGSSSVMASVIVVLMLTLVAAGTGLVAGTLLNLQASSDAKPETAQHTPAPPTAPAPPHGAAEQQAEVAEAEPEEPVTVKAFPFPPVLTSLAAPSGTWIRIEGSMLVSEHAEEKPEILVEQAATHVLAFLRTVTLSQIEGPSGLLYFRQDLNDVVSAMSEGQVREVLIHGLVVE